ncbi:MAG: VOC family protein [Balneolales bacterium]|nr:VOC family protein [Balneolales bacterium]
MKNINRLLTNICSDKLPETRDFYTTLFNFKINFESDWFIHLISEEKQLELGIIERKNDLVPEAFQNLPQGFYLTFVVENVDDLFELAKKEGIEIVAEPSDTFYGQRRLLLKDPNNALVDVSALIT